MVSLGQCMSSRLKQGPVKSITHCGNTAECVIVQSWATLPTELLGHCLLLHQRFSASGVLTWLAWFSPRLQSRCQTGQGSQLEIKDRRAPFQVYSVILANSWPQDNRTHGCLLLQSQNGEQGSRIRLLATRPCRR